VQIDALAVRLRPRSSVEAIDLGVRLCQHAAGSVYPCYAMVAVPVVGLALASFEIATWLPSLVIWCAKPWLDRTILFVLSRAAFGQRSAPIDVLRSQRQVWWRQFLFTWTLQRLSFWRALTQPVYQLEGLSLWKARPRVRQIRRRNAGSAAMMTAAFNMSETALMIAVVSLAFWLTPSGQQLDPFELLSGEATGLFALLLPLAYATVVLFLEPFYVSAGFAMYLNRRADLEAWDIEQEFRRAFAQ
jgi:hypothetical protein